MIAYHKPSIIILTETRLEEDTAEASIAELNYPRPRHIKVDSYGLSGGIWLLWNNAEVMVEPISATKQEVIA